MQKTLFTLSGIPERAFYVWALFSGLVWATNITLFMLWFSIIASMIVLFMYKDGEDMSDVLDISSVPSVIIISSEITRWIAIIALAAQGWFFTAMCYTITGVFVYSLRTKYIAEAKAEEAKNEADRKS